MRDSRLRRSAAPSDKLLFCHSMSQPLMPRVVSDLTRHRFSSSWAVHQPSQLPFSSSDAGLMQHLALRALESYHSYRRMGSTSYALPTHYSPYGCHPRASQASQTQVRLWTLDEPKLRNLTSTCRAVRKWSDVRSTRARSQISRRSAPLCNR